jgi:hypothetical protein
VLLTKYYSGDKIEKNEMDWACSTYRGQDRCIQEFGGKPEGKMPLGKPKRRWKDKIKMDFQEEGLGHGLD